MTNEFALDLKVARRKSGLTQEDCAHLLGTFQPKISQMEAGKTMPSVREICTLSIIYGKSFESLFSSIFTDAIRAIRERLTTLPDCPKQWMGRYNRNNTLNALSERLETLNNQQYGSAT